MDPGEERRKGPTRPSS